MISAIDNPLVVTKNMKWYNKTINRKQAFYIRIKAFDFLFIFLNCSFINNFDKYLLIFCDKIILFVNEIDKNLINW